MIAIGFRLALAACLWPAAAGAAVLAPHHAVYELKLSQSDDIVDGEGRIALVLRTDRCGVYDLDYRFVARYQQDEGITLTDQQTVSKEARDGKRFEFTTRTFVDGSPEKEIRGEAEHAGSGTKVEMREPVPKTFALPLSLFPMQHTAALIDRAKAGETFVEAALFDGNDDAEKLLTSTAILTPIEKAGPPGPASASGEDAAILKSLDGLKAWRVVESYYNSDSNPDGLPVFETRYVLYENGVADDLVLDFGTYAFSGTLSKLELFDATACR